MVRYSLRPTSTGAPVKASQAFRKYFGVKRVRTALTLEVGAKVGRGIDRMTPQTLADQSQLHTEIICRKVLSGRYRFSPYVEILRTRGANREPRVISFPTARDRVVLLQLKRVLHDVFPDLVPRSLPNEIVRQAAVQLSAFRRDGYSVLRTDICNFYPTIDHAQLLRMLRTRIRSERVISLIERALRTPTVPSNYRKLDYATHVSPLVGVPQGLAISNVLASIYLSGLDQKMRKRASYYCRYVDDIIVVAPTPEIDDVEEQLNMDLTSLGLCMSAGKTSKLPAGAPVEFLGYRFESSRTTIRKESAERFLGSIASMATSFRHSFEKKVHTSSATKQELISSFIDDVNERITGAIYQKRRYGWLFYYLELDDLTLLSHLDSRVSQLVQRLSRVEVKQGELKRLLRAYHEAKNDPLGGYTRVYDRITSVQDKQGFLRVRGHLDKGRQYSELEIETLYGQVMWRNLGRLERDVGKLS